MFVPKRILHPTDFSDCSALAFEIAIDMAKQNSATLIVLHVVESLGADNASMGQARTELEPETYRKRLMEEIKKIAPPEGSKIPVEHVVAEGDPADQIDRFAKENKIDLIVMGTHGRTGMARFLMGSVTEKALRHTPCPVLVIRTARAD